MVLAARLRRATASRVMTTTTAMTCRTSGGSGLLSGGLSWSQRHGPPTAEVSHYVPMSFRRIAIAGELPSAATGEGVDAA